MITHPKPLRDYFTRVGAEVMNYRRAMVKSYHGHYYAEKALIKINADGSISCSVKEYAPTKEEAEAIKEALQNTSFPITINARDTRDLVPLTKGGPLYEFKDRRNGEIIMVQERRGKGFNKRFYPWVLMSDGQWVSMEPDGKLPFWKPDKKRGPGAKIMIHEGAGAAEFATNCPPDHPWAKELALYEHWGMIGGALAPHRTDYSELRREQPTEVVYACDNDDLGWQALQMVSKAFGGPLTGIDYGERFGEGFDIADDMPEKLFTKKGRYIGPSLHDLMVPATWATTLDTSARGRPKSELKREFVAEWRHAVRPEVFVHVKWPNRILSLTEFNSRVAPFSHVDDVARLLKKEISSKADVIHYRPGDKSGIYSGSRSGLTLNTFVGTHIKAEEGDAGPWLEFMKHLVPDEADRLELMRWCATLIARPEIRILYGVLLISEVQGVGKGTLGEKILAPLVGTDNVSYPSEQEIVDSNYNYWLAHKRLAVVHEIYSGHSSKAYNRLKSCITDRFVTVQKKYQANYQIENWVHVFACSNSMRAVKLSADDRRWFVPAITEEKRDLAYWEGLNDWLTNQGGLGIIHHWAKQWVKDNAPVKPGAAAPWSQIKKVVIEEAYSPGQALVARVCDDLKRRIEAGELPKNTFIVDMDLVALIRDQIYEGRHSDRLEKPLTCRNVAKACGWYAGKAKVQITGWGLERVGGRLLSLDEGIVKTSPVDLGGEKLPANKRREPFDILKDIKM